MTYFINLSLLHKYSISETIYAYVNVCKKHTDSSFAMLPNFFQYGFNYVWVAAQYQLKYSSLIEPYKLGKISTDEFLEDLADIFYFLKPLEKADRDKILATAWNASIEFDETSLDKVRKVIEIAKSQKVYLISNTNELNAKAIVEKLQKHFPDNRMNEIDVSIKTSQEPIEIMPNVFLCLSYRFAAFKHKNNTTDGLIDVLNSRVGGSKTLLSQYAPDCDKAKSLGIITIEPSTFFENTTLTNDDKAALTR